MSPEPDFEMRLSAVEERLEIVAADAAAARHLAAARDRDLADLAVKVDANRIAINAHAEQTAAGFADVRRRLDEHSTAFVELRGVLDRFAAGQQQIVDLLNTHIANQDDR